MPGLTVSNWEPNVIPDSSKNELGPY
ncbi:hypothetical protein IL54_2463 [Sphingobium sp. ba1]|nr:hypothetical protein IL54_2463 [Sphingobium sp. ba1]